MVLKKEQFWQRVEKGIIDPLYLLYGQEEFLIRDGINRIKKTFIEPEGKIFQNVYLFGDEVQIDKLIELASTLSFNNPKRLIAYKLMTRPTASDKELISSYMGRLPEDTVIIFTAEEADLNIPFFKYLKEEAVIVRFYSLFENQIPDWIKRKAAQMGIKITTGAARLLLELVGQDLSLLVNELEKMSIYLMPKNTIDIKDVEKTVGNARIFSVFELTKSLGERNTGESLKTLQRLIDSGQSPVGIVALIGMHFRRLFFIKNLINQGKDNSEIARYIGISPFFIKEYIQQARLFGSEEIKSLFELFFKVDLQLKSSPLSQGIILESLVFKICNPSVVSTF